MLMSVEYKDDEEEAEEGEMGNVNLLTYYQFVGETRYSVDNSLDRPIKR